MDFHHLLKTIRLGFKSFLQKILMSVTLFIKNELPNHAGASAFFFLLSIAPVLLLLLIVFERAVAFYPGFSDGFFRFLSHFNSAITKETLVSIGLLNLRSAAVNIIGILSMLWAARLIFLAVQRGIGIIFPADKPRTPLMQNLIAFACLPLLVILITVIVFVSIGLDVTSTLALSRQSYSAFLDGLLIFLGNLLPYGVLFLFIFSAYRFIPVSRPRSAPALLGALLCTAGFAAVQLILSSVLDVTRFNLIYGVLGSLVLALVSSYIIFQLFFLFAQFVYVADRFDVLVLERMFSFRSRTGKRGKIETYFYNRPEGLLEKYARSYAAGDVLFNQGDTGKEVFYVYQGEVGIYLTGRGRQRRIAGIGEGEVFGEMAYLLNEPRTAAAVFEKPSLVLVLTPEIFEGLLKVNRTVSREVIELLCDRLKATHRYRGVKTKPSYRSAQPGPKTSRLGVWLRRLITPFKKHKPVV